MANYLNNSIARYRQMGADLMGRADELDQQEPNYSAFQRLARDRQAQGQSSMLNALAAQFAGERFQPIQAQYLKRAMAAQEPVNIGNRGFVGEDGQVVIDPMYQREKTIDNLRRRAVDLERLATNAETAAEREAARREQNTLMNEFRKMQADTARMNAETQRMFAQSRQGNAAGGQEYSVSGAPATPRIITPEVQPDEALGLYGAAFSTWDKVADAIGAGDPNAPTKVATERLETLGNQTQLYLQDAVPGRPSNYLLQMMERQVIRPNQLGLGKSGAASRADSTRAVIETGLSDLARILNNPQGYSSSDISKARDSYSRLSILKAEYDALSSALSRANAPQEAAGMGGLSAAEEARLAELEAKARAGGTP